MFNILTSMSILIVSTIFFIVDDLDFDKLYVATQFTLLSICLWIYIRDRSNRNKNLKSSYLSHSIIFIIAYLIVHFQYPLDFLLGFAEIENDRIWINEEVARRGLALALIGFTSFIIGNSIRQNSSSQQLSHGRVNSTTLLLVGTVITLVIYLRTVNVNYLLGNYGSEDIGSLAAYSILLFKVFCFAYLIQRTRNDLICQRFYDSLLSFIKDKGILFNGAVVIYLITVLASGDRGPIIFWTMAYYANFIFVYRGLNLKVFKTIFLVLIGLLLIAGLGHFRSTDSSLPLVERLSQSITKESRFKNASILPATQDLASSIRTVHMALDYVPTQHDFMYGRFQYQQVSSIFPFSSVFNPIIFDDVSYQYSGSSRFLTWLDQGDDRYSGVGSSTLADFYLDLGLPAVIIGLFSIGIIMRKAEVTLLSSSLPTYFNHTLCVCMFSVAINIPRSTFLVEFKLIVWVYVMLLFNRFLSRMLRSK